MVKAYKIRTYIMIAEISCFTLKLMPFLAIKYGLINTKFILTFVKINLLNSDL